MRHPREAERGLWACLLAVTCFVTGCPDSSVGVGTDVPPSLDLANDLTSADVDDGGPDAIVDVSPLRDAANDLARADVSDTGADGPLPPDVATDVPATRCVTGMSVACACIDGRMGAQTCLADGTYGPCTCAATDGGAPDATLPPLPARLLAPQSVSRVTSQRPTMRWVLPDGVTRARVQVCGDRACTRMLAQQDVTGTSWRPTTALTPGVAYWRVRGLGAGDAVVWSSATWEFVVGRRDAPVDTSFGTIKDFNGDGFDDLAVSTGGDDARGHTVIYPGRATGGATIPTQDIEGTHNANKYVAGDFNGDGLADLATCGAGWYEVQIRYGSLAGLPQSPSLVLNRVVTTGFGQDVMAGDINGDGFSDLVVRSYDGDGPPGTERFVFQVLLGGDGGLTGAMSSPIETLPEYSEDGAEVRFQSAGDVNGDGYADLLTGFQRSRTGSVPELELERGRAWVVTGHPSLPLRAWVSLPRPDGINHFGGMLAGVGDLNGDGVADFAIRSTEEVSIYLGTGGVVTTRPARTIRNPETNPCFADELGFGSSLGNAGDYDGDGRADLAVGASCLPYLGGFSPGLGSVYLYRGQSEGVAVAPVVFRGPDNESLFGGRLGGVGDFNGDGFGELAILQSFSTEIAPPTVFVLPGSADGPSLPRAWHMRSSASGMSALGSTFASVASTSRSRGG